MLERPPFRRCISCGRDDAAGILWVGGDHFTRRCRYCRASSNTPLPAVDKKVLYLDQFALSEIYKVNKGMRPATAPNHHFWTTAAELLRRAILRQQLICPASDIHHNETIVFRDASELALAHEMMGGDVSFVDAHSIQDSQIWSSLRAYESGEAPPGLADLEVDEVLEGHRNNWLSDLHITVKADWSAFVARTRSDREAAARSMEPLYERWANDKPGFDAVLEEELAAFGAGTVSGYQHFMKLASAAQDADDTEAFFDAANAPVVRLIHGLNRHFERDGGTHAGAILRTGEFLRWPPNERLPHHWVSAHLFAAIAHRLSSGQRRFPSRGMLNDIKAIATYGPYVDAMFLDKECESLIRESNLARRMGLRASVFSLNNTEGFLTYLSSLIDGSSDEVVTCAREIFGDDV